VAKLIWALYQAITSVLSGDGLTSTGKHAHVLCHQPHPGCSTGSRAILGCSPERTGHPVQPSIRLIPFESTGKEIFSFTCLKVNYYSYRMTIPYLEQIKIEYASLHKLNLHLYFSHGVQDKMCISGIGHLEMPNFILQWCKNALENIQRRKKRVFVPRNLKGSAIIITEYVFSFFFLTEQVQYKSPDTQLMPKRFVF